MLYETKFLVSLFFTLCIEVPIVLILMKIMQPKSKTFKIILVSVFASALTLPYLWFIFPSFLGYPSYIIIGEIFVFLTESLVYWKFLPTSLKKALLISFVANFFSLLAGLIFFRFV